MRYRYGSFFMRFRGRQQPFVDTFWPLLANNQRNRNASPFKDVTVIQSSQLMSGLLRNSLRCSMAKSVRYLLNP
jgi:hypothetical protein